MIYKGGGVQEDSGITSRIVIQMPQNRKSKVVVNCKRFNFWVNNTQILHYPAIWKH